MSLQPRQPFIAPIIPDNAPFTPEQRAWLNGFMAAVVFPQAASVTTLSQADAATLLAPATQVPAAASDTKDPLDDGDDGEAPWHDPALKIDARMQMAKGRPLRRRMMAAMAQQDCGQCGYNCENYSNAIVTRAEKRLNLCAPGGKETARMLKALAEELGPNESIAAPAVVEGGNAEIATEKGFSRDTPAPAIFLSRTRLNAASSEKETHHIEFDLAKSGGLTYEPGDALGIYANNSHSLVKAISRHLGVPLDEPISAEGQTRTLGDWLTHAKSLAPAPDALFTVLASISPHTTEREKLTRLAKGEGADGMDVLAALQAFRHLAPPPYRFLEALEPLQPRLYSISSSPRAMPGAVTLTVDVVRYQVEDRLRFGVASTFLSHRVQPGDPVRVYVQRSPHFHVPKDGNVPLIMVGPGTGIAPFRGFLQERRVTKARGKTWLFFGHQRQACDFFYREELDEFLAKGTLSRLSTAWSRDGQTKAYVQDKLQEGGADVWQWLSEGAHFYVCGDAQRMAKDVDRALHEIVERHGGKSAEQSKVFVNELKREGRYQADVY
jgi:sulfite reductase (NADPH) flavoprotein alpha-component